MVQDETVALCQNQTVTLDAGVSGMTYLWSNGATTQTTVVSQGGTYTVDVISPSPENCTSRKTVVVEEHQFPEIDRIDVNGTRAIIYLKKKLLILNFLLMVSTFRIRTFSTMFRVDFKRLMPARKAAAAVIHKIL